MTSLSALASAIPYDAFLNSHPRKPKHKNINSFKQFSFSGVTRNPSQHSLVLSIRVQILAHLPSSNHLHTHTTRQNRLISADRSAGGKSGNRMSVRAASAAAVWTLNVLLAILGAD